MVSSSIKESQHRIHTALLTSNVEIPMLKLNINLSPSDLPKSGSHFDLPLALLIMATKDSIDLSSWFAFGEIGLDGSIKNIPLIYPMLLDIAMTKNNVKVLLPKEGKEIFNKIPNIKAYFVDNIIEAINIVLHEDEYQESISENFNFLHLEIEGNKYYYTSNFELDFKHVKGQELAIKAALISACGFHNIVFEGSPGCGKSMIAQRIRYILPPLSLNEMLESVKIQAFDNQLMTYNPFRNYRNPHQSASKASIIGSAHKSSVHPGEIALANNGMIFFDELPHFDKEILGALREPLENNKISISRVHNKITYDTSFLFVGAMNPCPCGNRFSITKECRCKDVDIINYQNKISEPFWDRIDLYVRMQENEVEQKSKYNSASMQKLVFNVFKLQIQRGQVDNNKKIIFNGKLKESEVDRFCILNFECQELMEGARKKLSLSNRGIQRIKKVARTIADIENSENILRNHLLEALSYRRI